jgi:hypothetical protein
MKKWNHYVCACGGTTVARHDNEGVTPFIIRCRAKDTFGLGGARAHGCEGMAESIMFSGSQADDQVPHVIFFRPAESMEAIKFINTQPERERAWLLDHYANGGSLMKENEISSR